MIRQRNFCTNAIRKIDIIITIKKPFSYFITKNVNRIELQPVCNIKNTPA